MKRSTDRERERGSEEGGRDAGESRGPRGSGRSQHGPPLPRLTSGTLARKEKGEKRRLLAGFHWK